MIRQSKTITSIYLLAVLSLIGLIGLGIYANSLDAPFVFDDIPNIVENPFIRMTTFSPEKLAEVLKSRSANRPVANLSFALNYLVHQYSVTGYRAVNLAVHLLTAFLVFLIA